ncbi:hypothetical protein J2TS4_09760 [Paenibacillus sp. J2TS4]|nr:hypothetical protein J2TS4_09760 [Paenibacillus sp. J2TS4]
MSGEDIVGHVALNIYDGYLTKIRENFEQIPIVLKHIVLLIDLDTEVTMNGISGYLENSSGCYLEDTIEALERIQLKQDLSILKNIQNILASNGI